jgi:hypothetical protein
MLIADRELARKNGQSSAAIRATELLGKELGMFIDRSDHRHHVERRFADMTPEERQAAAEELMTRAREVLERPKLIEGQAEEIAENQGGITADSEVVGLVRPSE